MTSPQSADDVVPEPSSLFGNSRPKSLSELVASNKGVIVSFFSGAFLKVLNAFDQPYEIFLGVVLSMLIWYTISQGARNAAILISGQPGARGWQTALVSFVDLLSIVMIMFFSQYVTGIATSEWEKAGFGKVDTIFVAIFFICYALSFLVLITMEVDVQKAEDYAKDQESKKKK